MPELNAGNPIGFVGAGRMAQALVRGIAASPGFAKTAVFYTDPSDEAAALFTACHSAAVRCEVLRSLAIRSAILFLAVKPQIMPSVFSPLAASLRSDHLVISVAAGIGMKTLANELGTQRVIRVMPNTPCLIGHGMSAMSVNAAIGSGDRIFVRSLLESVGKVVEVEEEMMDAVTGLSGSGPAYVFEFIQAMIAAGIDQGLAPETARILSLQTILGATKLAENPDHTPAELTAQVTSPGGTTLAGLEKLRDCEFPIAIKKAVAAATQRSIELSQT